MNQPHKQKPLLELLQELEPLVDGLPETDDTPPDDTEF
jgi:hypothetical protein